MFVGKGKTMHKRGARACQGLPVLARACQGVPGLARACQGLPGLARACQGLLGTNTLANYHILMAMQRKLDNSGMAPVSM